MLDSRRFKVEFQRRRAFGVTKPRKKVRVTSSPSVELLSELMVKLALLVPEMVVEAAAKVLTLMVSA
jgi:hypothetical protein